MPTQRLEPTVGKKRIRTGMEAINVGKRQISCWDSHQVQIKSSDNKRNVGCRELKNPRLTVQQTTMVSTCLEFSNSNYGPLIEDDMSKKREEDRVLSRSRALYPEIF